MLQPDVRRLLRTLTSPREAFEDLKCHPKFLVAMSALVLFAALSLFVALQKSNLPEFFRGAALSNGSDVDASVMRRNVEIVSRWSWLAALVTSAVTGPMSYVFVAFVLWAVFRLQGGRLNFKDSLAVTVHGFLPWCAQSVLMIGITLSRGSLSIEKMQRGTVVASNLAVFAPDSASRSLLVLLGSVDLFSLWTIVLLGIGFSLVGQIARRRAVATVAATWAVLVAGKVLLASS